MGFMTRDIIAVTNPIPVCNPLGPNQYEIVPIDTFTVFTNVLSTSTVSKFYMPSDPTFTDTLTTTAGATAPHALI